MFDFGKWLKDVFDNSGNAAGGGSKPAPAVTPKPGQRSKTPAFKQIKAAPQFTQPKLNIGGFDYTRRNDGTYLNSTGEVRTQDQLRRLQGINTDAANRQKKIDAEGVNPFNIAKDIVSAPVKVASGIGKGAADMAVGQINDWGNRVADTGSAAAEVIREFSGQNQRDFDRQTKYANEYQDMARSFQQRAKNAQNPAERQRYTNQARSLWAASDDVMSTAQNDIGRGLQATDPMKTISNTGMTALDLATLGKGKAILEGVNLGQKVTGQSLRTLGKNTLVTAGQGGGIGGAYGGLATMQQENATPLDYVRNMATGAAMGAAVGVGAQVALPVAGVAAKNTAAAANKVATDVGRDISPRFGADTHPAIAELDSQFKQLQAQFDSAPSVVAKRQAERAMRQNRVQRQADYTTIISQLKRDAVAAKRRSLQGGYLAGPGAKGYKSALERGEVFDGVDGKPRFEVDDSGAKIKNLSDGAITDALDHPKLFKEYPELKNVKVKFDANMSDGARGQQLGDTIVINPNMVTTREGLKGTLLHELQHNIQSKERFSTGGDVREFVPKELQKYFDSTPEARDKYNRLAGEAEARAVQKRMDMPMSERYVKPGSSYRGDHQIVEGKSLDKLSDLDAKISSIKGKYGLTKDDFSDITKLKKIVSNPESDVVIYRAAPKNELNGGDWVTTNKQYAQSIARENGGKVHTFTVKAKDLTQPDNMNDLPSRARFSSFAYTKNETPRSTFYDSLDVPKEDLIIRNGDGKAMSIDYTDTTVAPGKSKKRIDAIEGGKFEAGEKLPAEFNDMIDMARNSENFADFEYRMVEHFKADADTIMDDALSFEPVSNPTGSDVTTLMSEFFKDGQTYKKGYATVKNPPFKNLRDFYEQITDPSKRFNPNQTDIFSAPKQTKKAMSVEPKQPPENPYNNMMLHEAAKELGLPASTQKVLNDVHTEMVRQGSGSGYYTTAQKMGVGDQWNKAMGEVTRASTKAYQQANPDFAAILPKNDIQPKPTLQDALEGKSTKIAPDDPNRNWKLGNQVDEGYRIFSDAKQAAGKKMDEFRAKNNGKPFTKAQQKELTVFADEMDRGLNLTKEANAELSKVAKPTLTDALAGKSTRLPKKSPEATQEALIQQPQQKAPVSELGKTPELQGDRANSLATNVDRLQEQQLPVRQEAPQGTQQMPLSTTEPEFGKTGSLSSPYKPKITTKGTEKQVAVMQMTRDGDVVTSTNVNPKLKNKTEKKFAVNEDGELIPDRKGATSIIMDKDGRVSNVRIGKKVYGKEDFGDLSDVNDYGSALATMRRNVERGFGKETSEKMSRFLVDHQQAQATKMIERKLALMKGTKEASEYLGIGFRKNKRMAKKVSAAIQDFGEGVRDKASLVDEYGADMANKIETVDGWFRKQYDDLLDEANATLKEYGYDPIPKRKNYYTHFQDETLWKKFGLKMDEFKSMVGDPTLQDAMPDATRGSISNKLAGQSEFTQPGKRFNKFALQRKGDAHTSDAFGAFERYVEPTLNNIYMTPSISRARVISRAIAQDADVVGKDANKMLIQIKEWANDLAGKTNRFDRPIIDTKLGNKVVKTLQWTQKKAGQNTIVGNLSTAVMQPIVLAQTAGRFGYKNTVQGLLKQMTGKNSQEMAKSGFLKRRYSNETRVTATRMDKASEVANTPLELFEETATRSTWEAALYDAKGKGLKGDEAVRYADIATEKTVAGRAIGEKPEVFRSKAAGALTMYELEVANYWQQMGKEMTKTQAAKTLIAAYGLNTLLEAATGRRVGFDPVDAAIDMYGETQKEEKDWVEKAKSIGQRGLGETADNLPFLGQGLTVAMGDKGYRDLMGPESQGGRFGVSSPISTLAQNPAYLLSPFGGSQAKKTYTGLEAFLNGRTTNKDGETTVDIPQTPENAVRGTLFGPSAIPEVSQYYNNLGKKKVDQKAVQNQKQSAAGNQSLDGLTKEQQTKLLEAPEYTRNALRGKYLAENETKRAEEKSGETKSDGLDIKNEGLKSVVDAKKKRSEDYRAGFSDDDYAIVQMSKTDQKKLVSEGIISAEKLEGLNNYDENLRKKLGYEDTSKSQYINQSISEKSKTVLNQYYEMDSDQREDWFNKGRSNEYKYWKAKYENDKAEGKVSKIEDIRYKKALAKDKVGSRYTKDVRDLYNLSKADLYSYLSKEKKGAKLSEELIRYDQDLYNKGLTRYLKFKTGIAPSRGGRSGGRGSRGGRKAKKFDYKLDGFLPKGDSTNKKLYDLLKQAKMRAGKA